MRVLVVGVVLVLAACSDLRLERSVENARASALAELDAEDCARKGGKIEGIGIFGIPACVTYYSDGGNACDDESDCEGHCFSPEVLERGEHATGICERSEHDSFGCFSRIERGIVAVTLCQD